MSKKLGQLLEKMEYELVQGSLDTEVTDLAYDSRRNVVCGYSRNRCGWT